MAIRLSSIFRISDIGFEAVHGSSLDWGTVNASLDANTGNGYIVDTSGGAVSITLPVDPSVGDYIGIKDYADTFDINNLTIFGGDEYVAGSPQTSLIIDIAGFSTIFVYAGGQQGWLPTSSNITLKAQAHMGDVDNPHGTSKLQVGLGEADNTSDADKPVSTAGQLALNGKAALVHGHDKASCGLNNVDNTSDANKPVSTATQSALNLKSNTTHLHDTKYEPKAVNIQAHIDTTVGNPHNTDKVDVGLNSVDNTSDANKPVSTAGQTALNLKSDTTHLHDTKYEVKNTNIQSHIIRTDDPHNVTKTQVGLGVVDNTSDANKPVSIAGQTALDFKSDTTHAHDSDYESKNTNIQTHIGSSVNPHGVTKSQLGLGSVDDTSDSSKPVSTAVQTALNLKQSTSDKGLANGYASLDGSGLVPSTQLPAYVDDVVEGVNLAAFPVTGETGKIYVALDDNKTYRWSGSTYVYITSGAVDSVDGQSGIVDLAANYEPKNTNIQTHISSTLNPHGVTKSQLGLGSVDNTSDVDKPLSTAGQTALNLKSDNHSHPYSLTTHLHDSNYESKNTNIQGHINSTLNPHGVTKTQLGLGVVDNTSDASKPVSAAGQTALNGKADLIHGHSKTDVGLTNVDNTSDASKPISTATQSALNSKSNTLHDHDSDYEPKAVNIQTHISSSVNPHGVTKAQLGLSVVDNTSDASKPVSTAGQTALNLKQNSSDKGQANGYASLDGSGLVPSTQLPAYVDDVLEYASLAQFPGTGVSGKIYVSMSDNKTYRWSGSAYIYITSGAVDSVDGQTGVVNLSTTYESKNTNIQAHIVRTDDPHNVTKAQVGLSVVDNTSDASKPVSTAVQTALDSKSDNHSHPYSPTTHNHSTAYEPKSTNIQTHISSTLNPHGVTKSQLGLNNVNNTSDASKPVSTATQTALNGRAALIHGHDKAQVGLSVVDNTSDSNKPVSTATQTQLNLKQNSSDKGLANGYASLDGSGLVPSTQLPAYVDDVVEGVNLAAFPITGVSGKIYVALDDNKTYRWSGSTYVYITSGAVDSVDGQTGVVDLGSVYESKNTNIQTHIVRTDDPHNVTKAQVGLSVVDNTSDASKPVSTAGQTALNLKSNTSHDHDSDYESKNTNIQSHISSTLNPHNITKSDVGLSVVNNTSDASKPVSTAVQTALNSKADNHDHPYSLLTHNHSTLYEAKNSNIQLHISSTNNPHAVTKAQVGLTNVPNIDTTNADYLSSGTVPNNRLPARLKETAQTITDWNDASKNGWYMGGGGVTNAPTTGTWYIGFVEAHNTLYATQTVQSFVNDSPENSNRYRRSLNSGVWSSWEVLLDTITELDNRFLGISDKAHDSDLLDGYQSSQIAGADTIVRRNSSGDILCKYINATHTFATTGSDSPMTSFAGSNGNDTYGRSFSAAAARTLLNVEDGATAGGDKVYQYTATSLTAVKNNRYGVNTSGGVVTITLPASPAVGDEVSILDDHGDFAINNCILARNGSNIMRLAEDMSLDVGDTSVTVMYTGSTQGWKII